ncbi:MAG TPA: isocitrate dehydrogenase (NAD(+)) [Thermoanaerobaculia bacterium]|jgi:isocitrate dehydrogenase (NAD+)
MAQHKITLLPGDGIGPEVTAAVVSIIECAGVDVEWEKYFVGSEAIARFGDPLPPEVLESVLRNKVALKGPVTTPIGTGFSSINVRLRKTLDLYANLRPVRSMPNIITRYDDVDIIVVRENTEDLYSGLEHEVIPGVVESLKIITERASTRIARFAFEYARTHGRKRVTAVHKANIMKMSDGLFLQCFRNVSKEYPNVVADDRIIDNLCMQLVVDPNQFDILLLENLYGDIVSDLAAGLVGGLGVVAGANIGEAGAVFEAVHGSAPDIAGQNKANPLALLQSAVLMLEHIGEMIPAKRIKDAIVKVLGSGPEHRTRDIGGTGNTTDFTTEMCETLRRGTRAGD